MSSPPVATVKNDLVIRFDMASDQLGRPLVCVVMKLVEISRQEDCRNCVWAELARPPTIVASTLRTGGQE